MVNDPLLLIDAIGPFFRGCNKRTINWSKIPFSDLDGADDARWAQVYADLETFAAGASRLGFNAASLDDVYHLADSDRYEAELRTKICGWRKRFRPCFDILRRHGLKVYVTMDCFSRPTQGEMGSSNVGTSVLELLDGFLRDFPEVEGVIMRIGESDGKDVQDDFRSELAIKTASQANTFLRDVLPLFERLKRKLIFRTWTVGAYPIGDLMWHRETFAEVFAGIDSTALIVSMKYGESDFFRYLPLNRNFFRTQVAKIVELQTKREYEGCGEYPSFVGWEYERYIQELRQADNVVGCMVWCQTGGWVPFRRLAFIDGTAVWTELNTAVTVRLFRDGMLVEDAIRAYAHDVGCPDANALIELLRLSDEVIRELLYVEEFARQKLFFRRVRIPPLLQVYWNNIFISHSVSRMLRFFVSDHDGCVRAAYRSMDRISHMKDLARRAGMPVADIDYMEDTFHMMVLAREYHFGDEGELQQERIRAAKKAYKAKYPKGGPRHRYRIKLDFTPLLLQPKHLRWGLRLLLRKQRGYRLIDRLVVLHLLSLVYRIIARRRPQWVPAFARESAMGVEAVFR